MRAYLLTLFLITGTIFADDFKMTDGTTITGSISRVEPDGIVVATDSGIEKVEFERLPVQTQNQYGYDPQKAAEWKAKQAEAKRNLAIIAQERRQAETRRIAAAATASANDAASKSPSLSPAPQKGKLPVLVEGKTYTLADVDKEKFALDGKAVRIVLKQTSFDSEQVSQDEYRMFVKDRDASKSNSDLSSYNYIYFPAEGAEKMGLLKKTNHGELSFYVLVSPDKLTALGRTLSRGSDGSITTYAW